MAAGLSPIVGSGNSNLVVGANAALIIFTVFACIGLPCGAITAAKGRWGWFVLGVLTSGLLWIVGAMQPPRPGSPWHRRAERRSRELA